MCRAERRVQASPRAALLKSLNVLNAYGHHNEARTIAEWATAWFDARTPEEAADPWQRLFHASVLIHAGQLEIAQRLLDSLTVEVPAEYRFRALRASVAVLRGDTTQALADFDWFENLEGPSVPEGYVLWCRAVIAAQLGNLDMAVNLIRESGANPSMRDWPTIWYAPLRGYEPFEELVAPKG